MASKPKKQAVRLEPTPQELEQQMNELRNFMTQERRQELLDAQRLTPNAPRDLEFERHLAGKATPTFSEASKASQPAFGMYPQMKGKRVFNDREAAANAPLSALRGLASGTLGLAGDVESLGRMAIPNASARTFFPSSEDFQRMMPGRDLTATPTGAAAQFAGNLFADAGIMGTAKAGTAAAKLAGKGVKGLGRLTAEQIAKGMEGSGPLATALAPVSNRYMFIGPKAETWNPSKAEQAVKMEAAGKTPQEIWATTGTFRGADGNLRQEISDRGSKFMFEGDIKGKARAAKEAEDVISDRISESKSIHPDLFPKQLTQAQKDLRGEIRASKEMRKKPGGLETLPYRGNLAEIAFEHPELYKAYPELADWIVKQGGDSRAFLAAMYPREISIYKRGLTQDPRSSATHEFQHAVQNIEGWAPGGNTAMAFQDPEAFKILEQLRKEVATPMSFEDYVKKGGYGDDKETLARAREEYKDYVEDVPINAKKYDVDLQRSAAEEYYKRLTGEAESRATQARIDMTPEQRAAKFPAESYDRPQDVLINKPPHENIVPERVNFSDNPDTMQMDLTDQQFQVGGLAKLGKAGKGAKSATRKFMDVDRGTSIIKETGGEWFPTNVKQDMKRYKQRVATENADQYTPEQVARLEESGRLAKNDALNKWVEGNLTNYVKKQMGTADDPVRKLAEQGITHKSDFDLALGQSELGKMRTKAGFPAEGVGQSPAAKVWEQVADESINTQRAGDIQAAPTMRAKADEARALMRQTQDDLDAKFVKFARDKGFNEDEVDALLKTQPYGQKAKMVGDTKFEEAYENYMKSQGTVNETLEMLAKDNPWISKLDPETKVYQPYTYGLGFDHILDVLREDLTAGRIRPEQLNKVSMEQAVRRAYEYDQELAAKVNAAKAAAREGLPVYKEYPEGYKWIELNKPGSLAAESEAMGHSVRGYEPPVGHADWIEGSGEQGSLGYGHGGWEGIKSGKGKVYSLVNAKGEPHVTIEVGGSSTLTPEKRAAQMESLMQRLRDEGMPEERALAQATKLYPESETLSRITQIKGKSNRAPNEEYLPYVQDFVRSGKWSDVGDIRNTGLTRKSDLIDKFSPDELDSIGAGEYLTKAEQDELLYKSLNKSHPGLTDELGLTQPPEDGMAAGGAVAAKMDGNDFVLAAQAAGLSTDTNTLNKIVTRVNKGESLQEAARAVAQEGGRSVHISDNPDTMRLELAERKYQVGGIVKAAKAGKGLYSAVDKAALGLKRPMGTGKEFMAEIKSTPGVKATELKSRSLADIEAMPKMTKDKFLKELEARPPVKIEEKVLGQPSQKEIDALVDKLAYEKGLDEAREYSSYGDDIDAMAEENYRLSLKFDKDELEAKAREMLSEGDSGPFHEKYAVPGGENYREILLKMPQQLEKGYRTPNGAFFTEEDLADPVVRQTAEKVGLTPSTRKIGQEYPGVSAHFGGEPNILASIRVSDRMVPTYTPEQAESIGQRIAQGINVANPNNLASGAPEMAVKRGIVTPLEAAQYSDYRGYKNNDLSGAREKVLHVEEIQSDWHQEGRKARSDKIKRLVDSGMSKQEAQAAVPEDYGYSTNMAARRQELGDRYKRGELSLDQYDYLDRELKSVPDAPFKKDWQELALRKVMELAAEGGYNKVALTPGVEQASRYDLSQQIDNVVVSPYRAERGEYTLQAIGKDGKTVIDKNDVQLNELDDYIGKELADKARQQLVDYGKSNLAGVDLQVGGEGMKSFYDKMLPDYLNKMGKQYGVEISPMTIEHPTEAGSKYQVPAPTATTELHSFEVTPQMRQDITEKGLPLYQQIGVPIGAGAVGAEANDQPVEGMKAGGVPQKSIKDRIAEHRATKERKFQVGGLVKGAKAVSAAERAAAGRKALKPAKEAAVPLEIPRARPTTKDIFEAAERVGKQQAGEFVTNPLTGKTTNLAGRSKKEVERLKNMEYKVTPIKDLPEMKPYQAKVGEVNIAVPGDQTISDMLLESVDGMPIGTTSQGGALFGRGRLSDPEETRAFWASNIGPAELFQKKVTELARLYNTDEVTAYHLAMGTMSNNFAQHLADAGMRATDYSKLSAPKMKAFDRVMREGYIDPVSKERIAFPNWPGIAFPEESLQVMKEDPLLRKWYSNRMKTPKVTGPLDLPNVKSIEYAMTEPEIRDMEINLTGLSAGRMRPEAELMPEIDHSTYTHKILGTAMGRAPELAPFSISFPDVTSFVREKYRPQDFTGTIQKVFPHQVVDEAYLEDMNKYYEQLRKVRGYNEGGAVKKKTKNQRKLDKPRVKISSNPDTMYMELNSKRK